MSFARLNTSLSRIQKKFVFNTELNLRKVSIAALTQVVLSTPVDKGVARGNWNVGVNTPNRSVDLSEEDTSGARTMLRGQGALGKLPKGDSTTVYITNDLPYIDRLNQGYSPQAPAGFVKLAADAAIKAVRAARYLR